MEQTKNKILWIDDEIELLKPHILLLEQRGYSVETATNGEDALEMVRKQHYDLIFLDEMMVGISGLETLPLLKDINKLTPIVMVTKNEAESVMEEAIGKKIDDYLTKPVNPAQIIAVCKKFLEAGRIESEHFTQSYLKGFAEINAQIMQFPDWEDWIAIYTKLVNWSIELDRISDNGLRQSLNDLWRECNTAFSKFIEEKYYDWINGNTDAPILSHQLTDNYLLPLINQKNKLFFIVIDCLRLDQWLMMQEILNPYYTFKTNYYYSILPTATPYARNAIFAGLTPLDIKKYYPQFWTVDSNSEDHKQNAYESELFETWLRRKRINLNSKPGFVKIFETEFGKKIEREILQYLSNQINVIVINAVDMIAHSRSDFAILKEIAPDESAYRSLTRSWFQHSSLFGIFKTLSKLENLKILLTTDHGSIRCLRGAKVLGDRDTSTCLRYKFGKNVKADSKFAMQITDPEKFKIPRQGITVNNIIAKEDYYFVYPTDYHFYLQRYRDSFQHGGISLEEMIIPVVELSPRQ